jgi:glyceraldehyde 3-phosphate dehydrogenase
VEAQGQRYDVTHDDASITVDGHRIPVSSERDPVRLGKLRARDDAAMHLKAGARRVLISAPGKGVDATLVPGVNADTYDAIRHEILSAASCTTNCVAPMASVLHEAFGIARGFLTTCTRTPTTRCCSTRRTRTRAGPAPRR